MAPVSAAARASATLLPSGPLLVELESPGGVSPGVERAHATASAAKPAKDQTLLICL
jgi:hypothetical protein